MCVAGVKTSAQPSRAPPPLPFYDKRGVNPREGVLSEAHQAPLHVRLLPAVLGLWRQF